MAVVEIGVQVEVSGDGDGQWYEGAGKAEEDRVEEHGDIWPVFSFRRYVARVLESWETELNCFHDHKQLVRDAGVVIFTCLHSNHP